MNEAFSGFGVRYYLIVILRDEEDMTVVFPTLLPGRAIVEKVWRGVRRCLYEGEEVVGGWQAASGEEAKEARGKGGRWSGAGTNGGRARGAGLDGLGDFD